MCMAPVTMFLKLHEYTPLCTYQWYALHTTPGAWWGIGGEFTYPHTWPAHRPMYHPPTHLLQIPYISLSCTVCDREIWVFAEFTKNFRKMFRKKMCISFEWIGTIPTEYQFHGKDFDGKWWVLIRVNFDPIQEIRGWSSFAHWMSPWPSLSASLWNHYAREVPVFHEITVWLWDQFYCQRVLRL